MIEKRAFHNTMGLQTWQKGRRKQMQAAIKVYKFICVHSFFNDLLKLKRQVLAKSKYQINVAALFPIEKD